MPLAFDAIPASTLVPLFWAEVKPAQTPYTRTVKLLLIGHRYTYNNAGFGDANLNQVYPLSGDSAHELFGPGSMLDAMYRRARAAAPLLDIRGIAIDEPVGGVRAYARLTVAKDANAVNLWGRLTVRIGGYPIIIYVSQTDTKAQIATKLKTAINKAPSCPCYATPVRADWPLMTGTAVTDKVGIWPKFVGAAAHQIKITLDEGEDSGRTLAERMLTTEQLANGAGYPALAAALAALSDVEYHMIVQPFDQDAQMAAMTTFMDGTTGRWSPFQQLFGHVVTAKRANYAAQLAQGDLLNDGHLTLFGLDNCPAPEWEIAAATAAACITHMEAPPEMSRPLQGLEIPGIAPPLPANRFDIQERNALYAAGIASYDVMNGRLRINRAVTTYKKNAWGVADASWRDMETLYQSSFFVQSMKAAVTGAFPRAALTDNDTGIPGFASPAKIKDVLVHEYKRLEALGLVENSALFAENLIVERNGLDANRVDVYLPIDVVNQLRVVATLVETHLQLRDSAVLDGNDITEQSVTNPA